MFQISSDQISNNKNDIPNNELDYRYKLIHCLSSFENSITQNKFMLDI